MGIDRIGKGGAPPAPEVSGGEKASPAGKTFEVAPHGPAPSTTTTTSLEPGSPLARLRSGEIDVKGYVDLEVEAATKSLSGMPPAELAEIKRVLRDQMVSDPGLSDLLRQATGQAPPAPEAPED